MQEQRHVFTGYCFSSSKRKLKAEGQTSSTQARTLPACLPAHLPWRNLAILSVHAIRQLAQARESRCSPTRAPHLSNSSMRMRVLAAKSREPPRARAPESRTSSCAPATHIH